MSTEYVYILWVRHCQGCHNVAYKVNMKQKVFRPALCTSLGEKQSLEFGKELGSSITNLVKKLEEVKRADYEVWEPVDLLNLSDEKFEGFTDFLTGTANGPNTVSLYSSTLPRAMETAKFISKGLLETSPLLINSNDKIQRVNYIHEKTEDIEFGELNKKKKGTVNSTTKGGSDKACCFLNNQLPVNEYLNIDCSNILQNNKDSEKEDENPIYAARVEDLLNNYSKFKTMIIEKKFPTNKLHIIVSHSAFLLNALGFKNKMDNLDAFLVVYNSSGEEVRELRQFYKFNTKEWYIPPVPPDRGTIIKRKLDGVETPGIDQNCNYHASGWSCAAVPSPAAKSKSWWIFGGKTKKRKTKKSRKSRRKRIRSRK
jgi:hypothetical protein